MSIQSFQNQHEEAYASLMRGLRELDLQGPYVPSDLLLIGDHAFPLAMNSQGHVLMAASLYGSGRIVVLGHEGYLTAFPALVENAVTWLRGDGSDNLSVGVHRNVSAVADNLQKSRFQAEVVGAFRDNPRVGVYVTDTSSVGSDPAELVAFLKAGGGVLIAGQAWSWAADHPKENTLHQFDGNKVSGVAGIYFSDHPGDVENLPVYPQIPSSWMSVVMGKDFEDDLQFLLQGISEFELPSDATASELLVHGPLAFPIGTTNEGRVFLAGGYYGQGRVIVTTHEGFMGLESLAPFWQNAIHWLDEGRRGVVGVTEDRPLNILSKSGLQCEKTNFRKDLSVFVCTAYITEHLEEIQNFVAEGGGLLIGGHAWWWAYSHPGQNVLTEFSGNKIINKMGLSVMDSTMGGGSFKAPEPSKAIKDTYHFRHLLNRFAAHVTTDEQLTEHEERCLKRLGTDCNAYLQMKAHDSAHYRQVLATLTDVFVKSGLPQVSEQNPVKTPKDHLLLTVGTQLYKVSPNPDALLPYLLKDNPLMPVVYNQRIKIDVKTTDEWEEWISTGLYLSPGMKTYVSIPPQIVNKNWKIQIGCQTDKLHGHDELRRPPCVHERFDVTSQMMQIGNLWGGLIYLVAPPKTEVKGAVATVQMAVPAPYYKSGVTTLAQWSLLRTAPSPWAELEFENVILIVPSDAVRNLERPDELAALWDEIMRAIADLAAKSHKFPRKERFLSDVQISHGYMHAGYPVMAHSDAAAELVGVKKGKGMWGSIHELGHNQQRGCWEFPPHTTECTCNLWSVYVHEEVLGINRAQAHEAVNAENRKNRMDDYIKGGRNLNDWSVFLALETYLQLQEKFGWDAIKKVFAAYHHMSNFPDDNKGKMNLYAETFSQTVGMNLTGFFKAWGWPIETATEEKLSSLPPWGDHPMTQYD